jgi:small subunit ribosomal protein S24e
MEITITSDKQNALLNRKELGFKVAFSGATPSRKMIHAKIAAMVNASKDLVVLDSLQNRFGIMQITGEARVYESKKELDTIELDYLIKRGMSAEEESEADAQDAPSDDAAEAS